MSYSVKDEQGRLAMSFYDNFYVSGGHEKEIETQKVDYIPTETITIVPNAKNYQPDDTCELLILAPFSPANGLVIFDCEGQVSQPIQFQIESGKNSTTVEFKISKDWIPNFKIHAELTGSIPRETEVTDSPHRPAIATGSVTLEVSRDVYKLNVLINTKETNKTYTPSSIIHIDVDVTQYLDNLPVDKAEICLIVVDEAVLSLTGHKLDSPLDIFYPNRSANIAQYHDRNHCLLFNMQDIEKFKKDMQQRQSSFDQIELCCERSMPKYMSMACSAGAGYGGFGDSNAEQKIAVRSNFNPLACWIPSSMTNSSGCVSFEIKLPDNLTRYRVWALATNDKQYGLGEMSFTVQLPIMIRPSLPRFLNYGDTAHISVILQNQTDLSFLLHAGLRATNAKLLTSQTNQQALGYSIVLQPSKRAALTFPLSTIHSGTARFQFIVSTVKNETCAQFGDAIELSLPVFTPATSEAFATYGDICEEEVVLQPVEAPKNVIPQFGELSISTSSTALASLTDAIISLYTYPYECTEQLSSRLLGIQALWDVLQAFHCKDLPEISVLKTKLESDLNTLKGRQYSNGGFGYWTNRNDSYADPYMSVHVAHCLAVLVNKKTPKNVIPQFGELSITTSSTALASLTDAIISLYTYPYECTEQLSSRLLGIQALWYVLQAFHCKDLPEVSVLKTKLESDLNTLKGRQYSNGGFGYWTNRSDSYADPYMSVHVAHCLAVLVNKKADEASQLFKRSGFDKLSLEALGWLLVALSTNKNKNIDQIIEIIYKHLKGKVSDTANFLTSYGDDTQSVMLHSNQRTDAILLESLLYIDPNSTLCTKLCKGLQAHKVKGAWKSTQENSTNAKLLTSQTNQQALGYSIVLQPSKRAALTFPLSTIHPGTARFQFIVSTVKNEACAQFGDAIELSLPVFTPATSEAFATYGDICEEEVVLQPVETPKNVIPQFGELSITTSSTALASLTDAIISLYTYPYECTEQLSSRLLGIQALWNVLQVFHCKDLPEVSVLKTKLESDLNTLKGRQYSNGGFGYWTNRNDSYADPYMSVHVAHCLAVLVNKKVFDVDKKMLNNSLKYLENIESEINQLSHTKYWSDLTRFSLISYALYVRAKHLQNVADEASQLFQRSGFDKLSLEALGWLLVALSTDKNNKKVQIIEIIYKHLKGKVSETSETANFITSYGDDGQSVMLHSNQRTDAILLEALLYIDPNSALCTKLCKGLQAHKVKGAWKSTQENCFVLIALDKYFHIKEKDTPDFVANIWLDNDYCGQHQYKGRTTNTHTVNIPMKVILSPSSSDTSNNNNKNLIMHKDGNGRLYYRIALNYAPSNLQLNAVNYGFKVERTYKDIQQRQSSFELCESLSARAMYDFMPMDCSVAFGHVRFDDSNLEKKIAVRSNFNPLACWIPSSITNSSGRVSLEIKLPDNLTR
ncbi:unnamed protein product [Rotaria sp. Silwood2]|nr:unnamed protein product [Rotaria sp. Silwood2]